MPLAVWDHWYEIVATDTLRQGDIFRRLPAYWFPQDLTEVDDGLQDGAVSVPVELGRGDWIILSASCDVDRGEKRYPHVLTGRVVPATKEYLGPRMTDSDLKDKLEVARRGLDPAVFLLPEHPGANPAFQLSAVLWRRHVTLPLAYLRRAAARRERLRLRSPLRERFGNWVGGNISSVGPEDDAAIPKFRESPFPAHVLKANDEPPDPR